ncbi:MAG: class B sortase [Blautia sp.]
MRKKSIVAVICIFLGLLVGAAGIYKYIEEQQAGKEYEEIQEKAKEKPASPPLQTEEPEKPPVEIPIDFETLQNQNPDIYAWIQIPGTTVDYPIVQSPDDNRYYLNHTVSGEQKAEGAIFTEDYNTKTFRDPNTVIYGHDMKNGSMFQSIHKYMDRSFFDTNRDITIYLPDKILHYKIFAAYLYDNRHLLLSFDFWDKEQYGEYLQEIFSMRNMNAFVDTEMEVTTEDNIITLSTCYAGISSQRYLVQAVLESIEE